MTSSFKTSRLAVEEITNDFSLSERGLLLAQVPKLLTQKVVEHLPPYFQGVSSIELANQWLDRMLSECRLFLVSSQENEVIGFIFIHLSDKNNVHIGYLLAEAFWGQGFASEMLQGFIQQAKWVTSWNKLIAGVQRSNIVSIQLLKKLGFIQQQTNHSNTVFYQLSLSKTT